MLSRCRGRVVTLRSQSCNRQTRPQKSYFKTLLPQYRSRSTAVVSFYNSRASVNYLQRIRILHHWSIKPIRIAHVYISFFTPWAETSALQRNMLRSIIHEPPLTIYKGYGYFIIDPLNLYALHMYIPRSLLHEPKQARSPRNQYTSFYNPRASVNFFQRIRILYHWPIKPIRIAHLYTSFFTPWPETSALRTNIVRSIIHEPPLTIYKGYGYFIIDPLNLYALHMYIPSSLLHEPKQPLWTQKIKARQMQMHSYAEVLCFCQRKHTIKCDVYYTSNCSKSLRIHYPSTSVAAV